MFLRILAIAMLLTVATSSFAQSSGKKKKTVITTTEEVTEDGKKKITTEKKEIFEDEEVSVPEPVSSDGLPTINESWYTLWGLGFSGASYSGDLGDAYEKLADTPGVDENSGVALDLLGFYWPLAGHKTMIGFVINGSSSSVDDNLGDKLTLTTSQISFSTHHFFGKNIGHGWFVRGDIGFVRGSITVLDNNITAEQSSDSKLGVLFGGGYGFSMGKETRFLLGLYIRPIPKLKFDNITYNGNPVSELKGTITSLTAGFLF